MLRGSLLLGGGLKNELTMPLNGRLFQHWQ